MIYWDTWNRMEPLLMLINTDYEVKTSAMGMAYWQTTVASKLTR